MKESTTQIFLQSLLVFAGFGLLVLSLILIKAESVLSPSKEDKKPIVKFFHRIGLAMSVVELIWSVDPMGVWNLYPAPAIIVLKDLCVCMFAIAAIVQTTGTIRVIFIALNINNSPELWSRLNIARLSLCFVSVIISDFVAIFQNSAWPRGMFNAYLALLSATAFATFVTAYQTSIPVLQQGLRASNPNQKRKAELLGIKIKFFVAFSTCFFFFVVFILSAIRSFVYLKDLSLEETQTKSTNYYIISYPIANAVLLYFGWIPLYKKAAAATVNRPGKRRSTLQQTVPDAKRIPDEL